MPGDKCILQLRGLRPFLSPKYNLKKHAEADKKNSFDISCLVNRRMIIDPDEVYTVHEIDVTTENDIAGDILDYSDLDDPDTYT
jgi:type IV secretion system protein VirD4